MITRVLKWAVPVDDAVHEVGAGQVAMVACLGENPHTVYVWTWERGDTNALVKRKVQVFGTGHDVPADAVHVGSAHGSSLVWHVFEVPQP